MGLYSLTSKEKVIQCKWDCKINHEHYQGSFENAVKYFGVEPSTVKSGGRLLNIVIYHQTDARTTKKLSNELFDILMVAQSNKKYFEDPKNREEKALEALDQAKSLNIIYDDEIVAKLSKSDRSQSHFRIKLYKSWLKKYG